MRALAVVVMSLLCSCGRPWPQHPSTQAFPALAHAALRSIDIVPVRLVVETEPGCPLDTDHLRADATRRILRATLDRLARRGLHATLVDEDGARGGDASLYIVGGGYLTFPRTPLAEKIAAGVVMGLVDVVALGLVASGGSREASDAATSGMIDATAAVAANPRGGDEPPAGESELDLELILVANATGDVLWRARQRFPADVRHGDQVDRAARTMAAALP